MSEHETFPHGMGNTIRRARTSSEVATAREAARRCTSLVLEYEEAGWDKCVPVILEAMDAAPERRKDAVEQGGMSQVDELNFWSAFLGWLIDNCEGEIITEEFLQQQAALLSAARKRGEYSHGDAHEQGHEPWPGTPGEKGWKGPLSQRTGEPAQNEDSIAREATQMVLRDCFQTNNHQPYLLDAFKWAITQALAARGVQPAAQEPSIPLPQYGPKPESVKRREELIDREFPAAQEGAPAAEQEWRNKEEIFHCATDSDAPEKPETAIAPEDCGNCKAERCVIEGECQECGYCWPLAITQASVDELQRQLAEAQEWKQYAEGFGLHIALCKSSDCPEGKLAHEFVKGSTLHRMFDEWSDCIGLPEKLATAQAACKAKDEALRDYADRCQDCGGTGSHGYTVDDEVVEQRQCQWCDHALTALAIQPS